MPSSPQEIFERYTKALVRTDVDAVVELFADDAVVRDPADGDEIVGREAIRSFFEAGAPVISAMVVAGPVCVTGDGKVVAVALRTRAALADGPVMIDSIDVCELDDSGRIKTLTGVYGPANVQPAQE